MEIYKKYPKKIHTNNPHLINPFAMLYGRSISSRFFVNSEVFASELLKNLKNVSGSLIVTSGS